MADENRVELTEEEKAKYKAEFEEQLNRFGEVYSQCWESEEFKQAFIADPKAIFDEYGINYDNNLEYRIIDTPNKTIVHVLPNKQIKKGMKELTDTFNKLVEDVNDEDGKQILLEDWKWEIYQNTENIVYIPIPLCPENLTPEELEMVNGGCLVLALVFAFVTTITAAATMAVAAAVSMLLAVGTLVALIDIAVAVEFIEAAVIFETAAVTNVYGAQTGAHVLAYNDKQQIWVQGE
ncbi:MAG: hypothetical protein Q4D29_07060 [Lachnospiraceae bacterium]|nr:hypothetical protein [Lachnospiraceae bacterium]